VIERIDDVLKRHALNALIEMAGRVDKAAAELGVGQATLYRWVAKYEIDLNKIRGREVKPVDPVPGHCRCGAEEPNEWVVVLCRPCARKTGKKSYKIR